MNNPIGANSIVIRESFFVEIAPDGKNSHLLRSGNITRQIITYHPRLLSSDVKPIKGMQKNPGVWFFHTKLFLDENHIKKGGKSIVSDLAALIGSVSITQERKRKRPLPEYL